MISIWICTICVLIGSLFILVSAIGMLRMPDFLIRMHAATKAGTLGTGLILIGVMFHFKSLHVIVEGLLVFFFIFVTAPIASHLLAKASYYRGVKLTKNTIIDELKVYYERHLL